MSQFQHTQNASDVADAFKQMRRITLAYSQNTTSVGLLSAIRREIGKEATIASLEDTFAEAHVSPDAPTSRILAIVRPTVTMPTEKVERRA